MTAKELKAGLDAIGLKESDLMYLDKNGLQYLIDTEERRLASNYVIKHEIPEIKKKIHIYKELLKIAK